MSHEEALLNTLRKLGYRITPQREMIVSALSHAGQHITAEEIYTQVQEQTHFLNVATIYRTLDLLVENGLANRVYLGDGQAVYATHHHGAHIHLTCRGCGEIIAADQAMIEPLIEKLIAHYGFTADGQHLSLAGLCAACQPKN